ncbi:DUF4097 family beta strand repeat-containing protein [Dethiothermospora halolimnae]|uniref:DUF4097 family beta strand repeat-containing protein n=1 Tax=Dethiothermospora halolimnae TaxID=3114390 RepID=UPI003CCBCA0B
MKEIINQEESFLIGDIEEISINVSSTNVKVISTDDEKIKVHFHGDISTNKEKSIPYLDCNENDKRLEISIERKSKISFGIVHVKSDLRLDIYIPKNYLNDVSIKKSSSDIKIENLNIRDFKCKSSSGDTDIESIICKNAYIDTSSGKVDIEEFDGNLDVSSSSGSVRIGYKNTNNDIKVKTSSGKVNINLLNGGKNERVNSGLLDVHTSSGKVKIQQEVLNHDINVKTSSGSVKIKFPKNSEYYLKVNTSSGNIKTKTPLTTTEESKRNYLEGVLGTDTNKVKIKTSSGSVELE